MAVSLAGLAVGIWLLAADTAVTNSIPDYLAVTVVIVMSVVALIAGLGVFATVAQMKENMDSDPNTGKALGQEGACTKDCCNSCGISLYAFLSLFGALLAFAMGVVAIHYSEALPAEVQTLYVNSTAVSTVEGWFADLDTYIDDKVNSLIVASSSTGQDWIDTQDLLGCCGWDNVSATPSIYLTGSCCTGGVLADSLDSQTIEQLLTGEIAVSLAGGCNELNGDTLTCKGIMLVSTEGNLLAVGIVLLVIFFVLLVCFVCALVVRYCSGGQGEAGKVAPVKDPPPKVDLSDDKDKDKKKDDNDGAKTTEAKAADV